MTIYSSESSGEDFDNLNFDSDVHLWLRPAVASTPYFSSGGNHTAPLPAPFEHPLYTVCALAVSCEHKSMAIARLHLKTIPNLSFWLPYLGIKDGFKYSHLPALFSEFFYKEQGLTIARTKLLEDDKLSVFEHIQLHTISQVQTPTGEFFLRLFYVAHWKSTSGLKTMPICCHSSKSVEWIPIEMILANKVADANDTLSPSSIVNTKLNKPTKTKLKVKSKDISLEIVKRKSKVKSRERSKESTGKVAKLKSKLTAVKEKVSQAEVACKLWGHEVVHYASILKTHFGKVLSSTMQLTELSKSEVFKYVLSGGSGSSVMSSSIEQQQETQNMFAELVSKTGYTITDIVKIYSDFVQHTYPAVNMGLVSFIDYVTRIKLLPHIETLNAGAIFRAMNYKVKDYLGFNELMLGLVALEPKAPHGLARDSFIFRYYDLDSDGHLDRDDLRRLREDLTKLEGQTPTISEDTSIARYNLKAFTALNLKGKSNLCRATKSPLTLVYESNLYDLLMHRSQIVPFAPRFNATCPKCRPKNYNLATHSVTVNLMGRLQDYKNNSILNQENIGASGSQHISGNDAQLQIEAKYHKSVRQHSNEFMFKSTSTANQILTLVRRLAGFNRMSEERKREVREHVGAGLTYTLIMSLCAEVTEVFSTELRVLKVQSPCYVMGDIHGNINDLLIFEEQLWQMAPAVMGPSVLFLGDYVDRGNFSIEVVAYLFAMKILAPNKFFLLRGNHEVRPIQRNFTFERECLEKCGSENGPNVFESFNRVFDIMPFAAIIDESIFCVHGGIPFTHTKIEDLQRAPTTIAEPEAEAPAVWEILWSDPITNKEYNEMNEFLKKKDETGYLSNIKRSTAFYFAEKATVNFLKKNNLSHVIRAHEVINEGYKLNHSGLVTTIFSSSHYCGTKNKAAAIMVEAHETEGFIKIILLDTD